jgi:tetratricopeptide (TPR) repeat protein
MQLAESDYALGRRARLDGNQDLAEVHLHNAAARLEGLLVELDGGEGDPLVDPDLYRQAMFRLGEIAMLRRRPDYVDALHRFLRARQRFPDSPIEGQLLVKIARCYAEIEADEQHVATLWNILGDERFIDNRDVGFQLEELLADLTDHVDDYPGPIEIRTMFYIAQYHWRAAQRDPATREQHLKEALSKYQRVLGEGPPMRLAQSARLGLSRASLMLGDETRAVQTLKTILRDPGTHPRDAELAAQLLGDHYYEQGRYRQAIQAYDGDVSQ